jgi:acyl carrier protein
MATVDEVIRAISEFCAVPKHKISERTSLLYDLGIDGDDADDLMTMLEKRFSVDLSDLDLSRYFRGEGIFSGGKKEEMTVAQLTEIISKRRVK